MRWSGLIGLILIVTAFVVGPMITQYEVGQTNVPDRSLGPSLDHWFGTDELGRDLFVRTAQGGRYSMRIGLLGAFLATTLGALLGAVAGYFGGSVDNLIAQLINLLLVVPGLIVLSVFALKFGATWWKLALVLSALLWTRIARVVRGVVLGIKEQEYRHGRARQRERRTRASSSGTSCRTWWRAIAVEVTLLVGGVIVLESTLSFLGFGVKPPDSSLGTLVADAKSKIDDDPVRVLTPGILIVLIVLCVNFLGDGLRDALDPKTRTEKG